MALPSTAGTEGSIVLLSGPVGAGKTTVARELVASSPGPTAYIEGDRFWFFIAKAAEGQSAPQRFTMVMRAMLASARHYGRDGYEVILDFSIPPWYLDGARALLKGRDFDYVVLRPSQAVCARRAAERLEGAIADYSSYRELYRSFDEGSRYIVEDDVSDARVVAARIRDGLGDGIFRVR